MNESNDLQEWYNYYHTAGHGYLQVPLSELSALGIGPEITHCSKMRGDYAYLEHDMDLTTFQKAKRKQGITLRTFDIPVEDEDFMYRKRPFVWVESTP